MAIISGYPTVTPSTSDHVLGTQVVPITEEIRTVQFTLGSIAAFQVPTSLTFTGDTGAGTVALITQTFTVGGTANEIKTSSAGQTLSISLADGAYNATPAAGTNLELPDGSAAITQTAGDNTRKVATTAFVTAAATQGYLESTTTLTAAQMLALHTTPVQLLPSPGGTKVVKLLAVSTFLNRTASSFSSNGSAGIDLVFPTNQLTIQARIQVILYTGSNDIAGSVTTPFQNGTSIWTLPLFATTATAILLGGTSTLSIKLRYQILDTSAF